MKNPSTWTILATQLTGVHSQLSGTTRTGVLRRSAARMATMALRRMRPCWDAAAATALAARVVGGLGLPGGAR